MLDLKARYVQRDGLVSSEMDDELVMMDVEVGQYFGLSCVGGFVWALLASPSTLAEIVDRVMAEFDVGPEQCVSDMKKFVEQLLQNGLLTRV